ncbi:rhamnulose-1-phosphate aldolase [Spirochaetia bacterium]|nr:rhamnulose-1-phosphate aldolase [Spirochaetia bacterium]
MESILNAPFMKELIRTCTNMYRLGWNERNGGNISLRLDEADLKPYLDLKPLRTIDTLFDAKPLAGTIFAVTGTGKYFKNVEHDPALNLGIIRIGPDGRSADLLWGFSDGGRPTSELPAHLRSHIARLARDPEHRVVTHCHSTNTLAMTFVHPLDDRSFTRTLWRMITECMVVFPEGIGVLPWMLCGTDEIGIVTARKMEEYRLCVWAQHGIFGAGRTLDEAFGLIETVEKAAEIYLKIMNHPIANTIQDNELRMIAEAFKVDYRKDFLD